MPERRAQSSTDGGWHAIRVYGSSKSLFDYLNYYSRQSDTGEDAILQEIEQKMRAQIGEIQKMVSDVQEMILDYPA